MMMEKIIPDEVLKRSDVIVDGRKEKNSPSKYYYRLRRKEWDKEHGTVQ
jgi:hypothetical protein